MYVTHNQVRIHFTDTGTGDPVVLSHGFLMDGTMFDRASAQLVSGGHRVITVDARGFGHTEADPDAAFDYWDLADDLVAVLDHLGVVGKVAVGGASQGGYVALRFALRYPDRTSALILSSTMARSCAPAEAAQYRAMAAAWLDFDTPLEPQARMLAPTLIGGTDADQDFWVQRWLAEPDRRRTAAAWEALASRDEISDHLPEISCPTLVLRGHADQGGGPAEEASTLAALVPGTGGVSVVIGGDSAGHGVWWTHPQPVALTVSKFLRTQHAEL